MALLVTSSVQIARFANALYGVKLGSVTNAAVLADISVLGSSTADQNALAEEDKKVENITKLIDKIRSNKINVRH